MGFLKPKKAKSTSENLNQGLITSTYTPQMQSGVQANNFLTSLLTGQGDTGAANAGYNNYLQQAGYEPAMRQLSQQTVGQGAGSGLLRSGTTATRLQDRGAELNQGFYNNYLQQLGAASGLGLQAGGLVGNVGQRSTSTGGGPSTLGSIASTVGGIAGIPGVGKLFKGIFSDRRLKENITKVDEMSDGLGIYAYNYIGSDKRLHGVMADEVAILRPEALGPIELGFQTVNYGAL